MSSEHIFERDDDVVYGRYIAGRLSTRARPMVFDGGGYWAYNADSGAWLQVEAVEIKRATMALSGAKIFHSKKKIKHDDGSETEEIITKTLNVSNARLNGVAQLVEDILKDKSYFDAAIPGLAFSNGFVTVDEKNIHLRKSSPDWRCRSALPFPFRRNETLGAAPKWEAFLKDVFRDDADQKEKIAFLQEFIGTALMSGSVWLEKAAMLFGMGSNGKSVFMEVIKTCFPSRNLAAVPPQQMGDEYYRARLHGVILNIVSELPRRDIIDSNALNAFISGELVNARRPREETFEYHPRAAHIFAVNPPLPTVADFSRGFWRRFVIVAFNRNYALEPMAKEKESFIAELKTEQRGIVHWALEGALRTRVQGKYTNVPSSGAFLDKWRTDSDQVALFVSKKCQRVETKEQMHSTADIYRAYRKWAELTGHRLTVSESKLGDRLAMLGHHPIVDGGQELRALRVADLEPSRRWGDSVAAAPRQQGELPYDADEYDP
jgi:P4 family phage/plasmid primase-like protien